MEESKDSTMLETKSSTTTLDKISLDAAAEQKKQDEHMYGGFHRRFLEPNGELEQSPETEYEDIPALRPAHRPGKTTINHGVFAVYNDYAGEATQTMTDRMCEGTYGEGKYPLHYYAYKDDVAKIRKYLKETLWRKSGADVTVTDHFRGRTALHVACAYGHQDAAETLLKAGSAHLHAVDHWGWTPLMYAVHSGHETMVRWMVSRKGAWLSVHGNREETAHTLSQLEHRGHVAQRGALTTFLRDTEDALTAQSAANGWCCTFGRTVHHTRKKSSYKKVKATFLLDGSRLVLHYRSGEFGLQWTTRTLNFHRIGRHDDSTMLTWRCSVATLEAYEAAMRGHKKSLYSKGHGKPVETWMEGLEVGKTVLELMCEGGSLVVRDDAEEVHDNDGVRDQREVPLESVSLEIPMPDGIHITYIERMLEDMVTKGRERGQENLEKERLARLKPPSLFRRMSTRILKVGLLGRKKKVPGDNVGRRK